MALGGGFFLTQNKRLPGTYHNFISKARAFANLADRGYVALPDIFDWFADGVTTVKHEDFQKNSLKLFGYDYAHEKLLPIREIFRNAHTVFVHAVNANAVAASNDLATAVKKGKRGSDIKIVVTPNVDEPTEWDVLTYIDTTLVDEQTVTGVGELVPNDYVSFKANATLTATAGMPLTGGSNGDEPTATPWQNALDEFEAYGFNALICPTDDSGIKGLFVAYTKRLRDTVGVKFQLVGHDLGATDHEGIIDVHNAVVDRSFEMVYWVGGAAAGCAVNDTNQNKKYNGEYEVDLTGSKTQLELTNLLNAGKYTFHRNGKEICVLDDINTFTSFTVDKNEDFGMNQVIRVLDQNAIDTAHLFNTRYLGLVPNDQDGRISLWSDICKHRGEMQKIRAIQNLTSDDVGCYKGESKKSVVVEEEIEPTVAMGKLYITTTVA